MQGAKRTREANPGVKITTSPTCCVKTFILSFQACVGSSRCMTAKEFFQNLPKNREIGHFHLESHCEPTLKIRCSVLPCSYPKLGKIYFCLLFIAVENMSSIHKKQQKVKCE